MANNNAPQGQQTNAVVTLDKKAMVFADQCTSWLASSIESNFVSVPKDYDLGSEINLAMLKIAQTTDSNKVPALNKCTKDSIFTSLKQMVTNGLSMARNQCYPIVYGDQLQIMRSYFGTVSQIERMFPDYKVMANVVYEGDEYEESYNEWTDCDEMRVVKRGHKKPQTILYAYGFIKNVKTKENVWSCVMDADEIKISWSHAKTNKVQNEFPQEMAKRTVIQRMCKMFINSNTRIEAKLVEAYNKMTEDEYEKDSTEAPIVTEKAKAIRQKSRGNEGLSAILNAEDATVKEVPVEEVAHTEAPVEEKPSDPVAPQIDDEEIPF